MPALLITHPFAIGVSGRVAAAEQGTDQYIESMIAVVIGTRLGERDMAPGFGVPDAAYSALAASDIQTCLDTFGPDDVVIGEVNAVTVNESVDSVTVEWSSA